MKVCAKDKTPADTFARFMRQVVIDTLPGACWMWAGNLGDGRYGAFSIKGKSHRAHRWLYEQIIGPIPEGMLVRHHCDTPRCVNPQHLEVGTASDNTQDMLARGRNADRKGERHPLARITDEQVRRLRALAAGGRRHADIAEEFGIQRQQVGKIVRRENWGHVR